MGDFLELSALIEIGLVVLELTEYFYQVCRMHGFRVFT